MLTHPETRHTNSAIFVKIAKGYAAARRLFSEVWSNFSTIFSFKSPIRLSLHRRGEIWHGGVPNFTPSVQRVAPVGRKTSKSPSD